MKTAVMMMLACVGTAVAGEKKHQDVEVSVVGGQLVTEGRVFGAELGELIPNFGNEPGFEGVSLPAFTSVGFDILDSARLWDGSSFDGLSSGLLTLELAPGVPGSPSATTPTAPGIVPGFVFASADASGEFHQDIGMTLGAPAGSGIYLLSLLLWDESGALGPSDPFWFVLNNGMSEEDHDAAIAYVESVVVPSPGAGLLAIGGLAPLRRRRR